MVLQGYVAVSTEIIKILVVKWIMIMYCEIFFRGFVATNEGHPKKLSHWEAKVIKGSVVSEKASSCSDNSHLEISCDEEFLR